MKKAATIGLALIAQLSFSAWQMKALAQDPMDSFASSSAGSGYDDPADTFVNSTATPGDRFEFSSYPVLQGWTWGRVGSWRSPRHGRRYRPAPTQIPSDGMIYRGGHWQIEKDGTTTWIPDENADFEGDAFTGLQDNPPEKDPKEFDSDDAHDPPNPDPFVTVGLPKPVGKSYTNASKRWDKSRMPLRLYISGTICEARDGKVKDMIRQCLKEWCDAIHGRASFMVTSDFKNADIYVLQRETFNNEWADNIRCYGRSGLNEVRIELLEETVSYLPLRRLHAVLLHETGHALGLIDHLSEPGNAMSLCARDTNTSVKELSEEDKVEMRKLYADDFHQPIAQAYPYARVAKGNAH